MRINEEKERINFEELKFKEEALIKVKDMTNDFVTNELFTYPLYKKISVDGNLPCYKFFPYNDIRIEGYCNKCKCKRIFCFENSNMAYVNLSIQNSHQDLVKDILKQIDYFTLRAQADCGHKMIMCFWKIDTNTIIKIGQNPSIYDMDENINNKKFLSLLDDEDKDYYKKACSLYSFNSCIGSMVYLRRIFEKLLIDTFTGNKERIEIDEDEFKRKRVEDKVEILKPYLPTILYEQGFNIIYKKISDGIHNLSEDECQVIFPILKDAIEEVLIEKIQSKEKEERITKLSNKILNM